jgi:hypothetical protein
MPYTIDDLRPILDRVRKDISAKKLANGTSIWCKDEPLTSERIEAHLSGQCLRGACPILEGENTTRLALLDLDSHKGETSEVGMMNAAQKIYDEGIVLGVHFEAFRSSGGRGIHLIAIWQNPQDAYSVRELMETILMACGLHNGTGGVAKAQVEVFPKQNRVEKGGCGNQFILPFSPKGVPLAPPTWRLSDPVQVSEKPAPPPKKAHVARDDDSEEDRAAHALIFVPNDDYQTWIDCGMGLKDAFGDAGFAIWDYWSSGSEKYFPREMRRKWDSFRNTGITIATLYDKAKLHGWKPAPYERPAVDTAPVDAFVSQLKPKPVIPPQPTPECKVAFDPLALPGLIGDTVRWICKDSMLPQPILALLNTIAFAGSVFGRRYASPLDTRTNIYMVGIADTGAGKDSSRKRIGKLAEAANLGQFVGAHAIRSDTGVIKSLSNNPCQLLMLDEFGKFLQALTDKQSGPHHKAVIKAFMTLYSDSNGVYKHGDYANPKVNEAIVVHAPNLCIYGTTTEKEYIKALNKDAVESGELNRVIAIKVPTVERQRLTGMATMDGDLVDAWGRFAPGSASLGVLLNSGAIPPEPTIVEWGDCDDLQWKIGGEQAHLRKCNAEIAPLWDRRHENIIKIAMIFAIARNLQVPTFQKEDFDVAVEIVDCSIKYMAGLVGDRMSENDYERNYVEILEFIKKAEDEGLTRSQIFRRFRKYRRKDIDDFIGGMIEQEVVTAEKVVTKTKPIVIYRAA